MVNKTDFGICPNLLNEKKCLLMRSNVSCFLCLSNSFQINPNQKVLFYFLVTGLQLKQVFIRGYPNNKTYSSFSVLLLFFYNKLQTTRLVESDQLRFIFKKSRMKTSTVFVSDLTTFSTFIFLACQDI